MNNRQATEVNLAEKSSCPWAKNPPREMHREKARVWLDFKMTRQQCGRNDPRTDAAWVAFTNANNNIKYFSMNAQMEYERDTVNQLSTAPKLFHSYVRHRRVGRPSLGPLKMQDGTLTDDPRTMANLFAISFAGVYDSSVPRDQYPHALCNNQLPPLQISEDDVTKVVLSIDRNSSPGSDDVHPRLLQALISDLATPMSIIFNNSLLSGRLPALWTESTVVPIFKKSSRYDPLNYRPVALTSVVCKIMERILTATIWDHVSSNNLMSLMYRHVPVHHPGG